MSIMMPLKQGFSKWKNSRKRYVSLCQMRQFKTMCIYFAFNQFTPTLIWGENTILWVFAASLHRLIIARGSSSAFPHKRAACFKVCCSTLSLYIASNTELNIKQLYALLSLLFARNIRVQTFNGKIIPIMYLWNQINTERNINHLPQNHLSSLSYFRSLQIRYRKCVFLSVFCYSSP